MDLLISILIILLFASLALLLFAWSPPPAPAIFSGPEDSCPVTTEESIDYALRAKLDKEARPHCYSDGAKAEDLLSRGYTYWYVRRAYGEYTTNQASDALRGNHY